MEFKLTDKELKSADKFKKKHVESCGHKAVKATEGSYQFTYMFTPNGFGHLTSIKCNVCGENEDITDISVW